MLALIDMQKRAMDTYVEIQRLVPNWDRKHPTLKEMIAQTYKDSARLDASTPEKTAIYTYDWARSTVENTINRYNEQVRLFHLQNQPL